MVTELQPRRPAAPGRVPPHNLETEQSVLAGILFDNTALPRAIEYLKTGEEFYQPAHRILYATFLELFSKNSPIDMMTVSDALRKKKQMDEAGGLEYMARIMELSPTAANVGIHAKIVKEKSILRRLITTSGELINLGYEDSEDVDQVIDRAEQLIFALAEDRIQKGFANLKDLIHETSTHLEMLEQRKELITGIPSGFKDLDALTAGFQNGDLVVIAGRPSMGKTAMALNIAEHVAVESEKSVAFFSLEMSAMQLVLRLIASLSRISLQKIRTGFVGHDNWSRIHRASEQLYEAKIFIDDTPMQTVLDIRSKARRQKAETGLDLVIIDYLQLLHSRGKVENRVLEVGEMTRSLKGVARELDVPIVLLSQLSRKVEERTDKRPQLSDLRESGSIEQDADVVGFVYREEVYRKDKPEVQGRAEFIIGKQRNGPTGTVKLTFLNECTRFENISYDTPGFDADIEEE